MVRKKKLKPKTKKRKVSKRKVSKRKVSKRKVSKRKVKRRYRRFGNTAAGQRKRDIEKAQTELEELEKTLKEAQDKKVDISGKKDRLDGAIDKANDKKVDIERLKSEADKAVGNTEDLVKDKKSEIAALKQADKEAEKAETEAAALLKKTTRSRSRT